MGLIKTGLKAAVAVEVAHVVHDRIERRKQEEWVAQGHPPETFRGSLSGVTGSVGAVLTPGGAPELGDRPQDPGTGQIADVLVQLRELSALRAEGVLTEAEFEIQKRRVLAQ